MNSLADEGLADLAGVLPKFVRALAGLHTARTQAERRYYLRELARLVPFVCEALADFRGEPEPGKEAWGRTIAGPLPLPKVSAAKLRRQCTLPTGYSTSGRRVIRYSGEVGEMDAY